MVVAAATSLEARGTAAERRASLTVTSGVSATVNPFLSTDSTAKAMLAELTLNPILTSKTAVSSVELSAVVGYRRYSGDYGSSVHGSGVVSGSIRKSSRLQLSGSAFYRREIAAEVTNDSIETDDPKSVRQTLGSSASASWRASEYDTITPNFSAQHVIYTGNGELTSYDNFSGGVAYSRRLSTVTSVGVHGSGQIYVPDIGPTSNSLSATATIDHSVSATIRLNGALGIQRISSGRAETGIGPGLGDDPRSGSKIYPSANVNLCRRSQWSNLCLTAAATAEPGGRGSLERSIFGGINYSRRLSESSNLSISADYRRSSGYEGNQAAALEHLQARASFDKKLNKSLTLGAFLNYRRRAGNGIAEGGSAGFSLRWMAGRH